MFSQAPTWFVTTITNRTVCILLISPAFFFCGCFFCFCFFHARLSMSITRRRILPTKLLCESWGHHLFKWEGGYTKQKELIEIAEQTILYSHPDYGLFIYSPQLVPIRSVLFSSLSDKVCG